MPFIKYEVGGERLNPSLGKCGYLEMARQLRRQVEMLMKGM
jgi:hypothetical protein